MSSSLGWCSLTPGFGKVSILLFIDSESRFSILPNQNCKWELSVTILERPKFEEGKKDTENLMYLQIGFSYSNFKTTAIDIRYLARSKFSRS